MIRKEARLGQASKKHSDGCLDGDTIIHRRKGEVLDTGVDFTYRKNKF